MKEINPILKKITENKLKLRMIEERASKRKLDKVLPAFDAGDPSILDLNNLNYSKYLKMSVKTLNNLAKPIKKKLQTDDNFLIQYAKRNSLYKAMTFACKDKLNESSLIRAFIDIEPSTAINKAGIEARKNAELVALAFQVANRRNVKVPKVPKELQENVEFLVSLVRENPAYVNVLTPRQMKDEKIMLTMLKTAPEAKEIKDIITSTNNEETLAKNPEFMREAIEISPKLVSSINPEDTELLQEVLEKTPEAEAHLNSEQKEALAETKEETTVDETKEDNKEQNLDKHKFEEKKELDASNIKTPPIKNRINQIQEDLGRQM